jgi:hypothetical protein
MRTLALCGASCKRRSFFYCTRAAWKSLQLLPLLMVEGYVGRSWALWTGAYSFYPSSARSLLLSQSSYFWPFGIVAPSSNFEAALIRE